MTAFTALLIAVLIGLLLDKALPAEDRAKLGPFRVARAHLTIGLFDFMVAYTFLRGILAIMGH